MWSITGSPGRQLRIVGVIALLVGTGAALARPPSAWDGLVESAALKVGTSARQLARTAGEIAGEGRVGRLSVLRSDAEELVRRTDALARMSQEPLPEGELAQEDPDGEPPEEELPRGTGSAPE